MLPGLLQAEALRNLHAFREEVEALARDFYIRTAQYPNTVVVPTEVAAQLRKWEDIINPTTRNETIGGIQTRYGAMVLIVAPDAKRVHVELRRKMHTRGVGTHRER